MIAKHTEKKLVCKESNFKFKKANLLNFLIMFTPNHTTNKWIDMCQS